MTSTAEDWISAAAAGPAEPCYLVWGDRVLSEPEAIRLGEALAARFESKAEVHRSPGQLDPLLSDLRTFSLFGGGKVIVAVETAILADADASAGLLEEAGRSLPVDPESGAPTAAERRAALLLMRALRLLQLDPYAGSADDLMGQVPEWALLGKPQGRARKSAAASRKAEELRSGLARLLELGRAADLVGRGASEVEQLSELVASGLPEGHTLVLAESSVSEGHPLLKTLSDRGVVARLGGLELDKRKGWQGLEAICAELERDTGVKLTAAAVEELARRTLRRGGRSWSDTAVDAESSGRFAAEYRKLAALGESEVGAAVVGATVEDRGEQDVWQILDAIGAGNAGEALDKVHRHLASSDDLMAARLSLFSLLAGFCRQLTAVGGMVERRGLSRGERNYGRFKSRIAPTLQEKPSDGAKNPLAGLHPFRLHRSYLAASRLPSELLASLPGRILQVELELKGESRSPDSALSALVVELAKGKVRETPRRTALILS